MVLPVSSKSRACFSAIWRIRKTEKHARDLLLTGRTIDAAEARRIGLITQIVPSVELMAAAQTLAATLLASSPTSLLKTKKLLCDFAVPEVDRELELAIAESAQIRSTADFREGLASFLEKRRSEERR